VFSGGLIRWACGSRRLGIYFYTADLSAERDASRPPGRSSCSSDGLSWRSPPPWRPGRGTLRGARRVAAAADLGGRARAYHRALRARGRRTQPCGMVLVYGLGGGQLSRLTTRDRRRRCRSSGPACSGMLNVPRGVRAARGHILGAVCKPLRTGCPGQNCTSTWPATQFSLLWLQAILGRGGRPGG